MEKCNNFVSTYKCFIYIIVTTSQESRWYYNKLIKKIIHELFDNKNINKINKEILSFNKIKL